MTILRYPKNRVGHIFVSWLHPFKEHRIVIIGSKGMFSYEDSSDQKNILFYEKGIDWVQGEPVTHDGPTEVIPYEKKMPLAEELLYFAGHLDGSPIERADAQNGIEVLEILEKATESLLSGSEAAKPDERKVQEKGEESEYFVHESALIDDGASIGKGTKIWHFSHVLSGSVVGESCNIGQNVVIGPDVKIGNNCKIQNNVSVYKGVTLEEGVFCGPSMVFTNVYNPRAEIRKMDEARTTLVKRGATIGANATIVCGITIGRYAFVGAGAVVINDVPDYALVVGNPARQTGWVCECGERLDTGMKCPACGRSREELRQSGS
jgi:UDP-2-acetamido-3-amino-2,3-dideoxy-glucuronate N-acetyltransferase